MIFLRTSYTMEVPLTWVSVSVLGSSIDLPYLNLSQWSSINTQAERRLGSPLICSVADTGRVCNLQAGDTSMWAGLKSLQPRGRSRVQARLRSGLGVGGVLTLMSSQSAGGCRFVTSPDMYLLPRALQVEQKSPWNLMQGVWHHKSVLAFLEASWLSSWWGRKERGTLQETFFIIYYRIRLNPGKETNSLTVFVKSDHRIKVFPFAPGIL